MKNFMLFAALAAALTLSSCAKEAPVDDNAAQQSPVLRTVHFSVLPTDTKTVFGDKSGTKYPVLWQEGDQICPSFNFADPSSNNYITVTPSADGTSASFEGDFAESESYRFVFISPARTFKSINKDENRFMVDFPSGQTSTAASPDPASQILYADTDEMTEIKNPVVINFEHLAAYLHIQFANVALDQDELVQAVNITANGDCYIAGRFFYYWKTGTFESSTPFNAVSVSTSTLADVWCAVSPVDLSSGKLTVQIVTDKGSFTKEVNMPVSANLTRGKTAKFTVNMNGISREDLAVYNAITSVDQLHVGDKVIIAAAGEDQPYAMSTGQNTNNRSAAGVAKTVSQLVNPTSSVEVLEVEDGIIPGHYAFRATGAANPGYLYAANQKSSGSNILRTKDTKDNSASWAVSVEDVTVGDVTWEDATVLFADIPSTGRGLLRYNMNDKLFTAYGASTNNKAIRLYRLDEPATNHFNVTLPGGNTYNNSAQEIPVYVFGNVAWSASVTGGAKFKSTNTSSASGTGNTILTLTVPQVAQSTTYALTVTTEATVSEDSFEFEIEQTTDIVVGDILFHEQYWTGSEHNQKLADYQASGNATTFVYGGATVTYTQDGTSHFYGWPDNANVFLPNKSYEGPLSIEGMTVNFRIQKNGGWLQAAGIPCEGVKKATLTFKLNRNGAEYQASSNTTGVTVGAQTKTSGTSAWGRDYTEYSYPLSFSSDLTQFNIRITDTHAENHIYIADIKIVVTEVYE